MTRSLHGDGAWRTSRLLAMAKGGVRDVPRAGGSPPCVTRRLVSFRPRLPGRGGGGDERQPDQLLGKHVAKSPRRSLLAGEGRNPIRFPGFSAVGRERLLGSE